MKEKLDYSRNLLQSCLVPELKHDLDSLPIQKEQFLDFHETLEIQLPILYDFVRENEWIFLSKDPDAFEVCACLYVLLSEITATSPVPVYKLVNERLVKYADEVLKQYRQIDDAVDNIIFVHFRDRLQNKTWKRHLGAIHGFLSYLNYRYNTSTSGENNKMSSQWLTFCLSVGLCIRESHEPMYKQIGTQIFMITMEYGRLNDLQNMNIHSVIYDNMYKDVYYMDTVSAIELTWNCLIKCLDFYKELDSLSWNHADEMIETLLRNITLAPNNTITICLLKVFRLLITYFTLDRYEIESKCDTDLSKKIVLEKCRFASATNSSYTLFHWARSILNVFIVESDKLMQCPIICGQLLEEIHKCYLVSILPIDLPIIEPHLPTFFDKFTAILMKVLLVQKHSERSKSMVRDVITTFYLQLQRSPFSAENAIFLKYLTAFEHLQYRLSICPS